MDGSATAHEDLRYELVGSALGAPVESTRGALWSADVEPVFVAAGIPVVAEQVVIEFMGEAEPPAVRMVTQPLRTNRESLRRPRNDS